MEKLVLMEAFAEVTGLMRGDVQDPSARNGGKTFDVPFSRLSRLEKTELLNTHVDWLLYSEFKLNSETAWRIVENAADGRPQEQWLEPVRLNHHESPRLSIGELLRRPVPESTKQAQARSVVGKPDIQHEYDGRSM